MASLAARAEAEITASAAVRQYFGTRDIQSASVLSRLLGVQTLEYDDTLRQADATKAKKEVLHSIFNGADPFAAGIEYAYQKQAASHRPKAHREVRTADEVMHTPPDRQYLFMEGLPHALYAKRRPYYLERSLAGKFHPNPYHQSSLDQVQVKTRFGQKWRKVITEPVDPRFASYPQYRYGTWSYIEGHRP